MSYTRWIHNVSGGQKTYRGVPIADNAYYEIAAGNLTWYQTSDAIMADLGSDAIRMSANGTTDYSTSAAQNIRFLLGDPAVDPETGAPIVTTKKLKPGWYFQYREIAWTTAKLNSVHDKDKTRTDLQTTTISFLDANRNEIVNPTQTQLDTTCEFTVVRFAPPTDWGVRSVTIGHKDAISQHVYVNADINILVDPAPVYLTLPQANGGLDLFFVGPNQHKGVEEEGFTYFTSNDFIEFDVDHGIGIKHAIQAILALALPIPGA